MNQSELIEKVAQASGEIDKLTTSDEEQAKPQAVVVKRSAGRGKETVPLVVLTLDAWTR